MKKTLITAATATFGLLFITALALPVFAATTTPTSTTNTSAVGRDLVKEYIPLSATGSIPGLDQVINQSDSLQGYLMLVYTILISVGIVLALILTVYHGFQYSISDIFTKKINAKEALTNIAIGLGLILGAYLILFTINPAIVNVNFNAELNQATSTPKLKTCGNIGNQYAPDEPTGEGVFMKLVFNCYDPTLANPDFRDASFYTGYIESYEEMIALAAATAGKTRDQYLDTTSESELVALQSERCNTQRADLLSPSKKPKDLREANCVYRPKRWSVDFEALYDDAVLSTHGDYTISGEFYSKMIRAACQRDFDQDRTGAYTNTSDHTPFQYIRLRIKNELQTQKGINVDINRISFLSMGSECTETTSTGVTFIIIEK